MAIHKSADLMLLKASGGETPLRLTVYLPGQRRDGSAVEGFEETADEIAALLYRRFGRATTYAATGNFTCGDGLRRESVRAVEFFCHPERLDAERRFLHELLLRYRGHFGQECVALSMDGSLMLMPLEESPMAEAA